jgi:hypothetical protein
MMLDNRVRPFSGELRQMAASIVKDNVFVAINV